MPTLSSSKLLHWQPARYWEIPADPTAESRSVQYFTWWEVIELLTLIVPASLNRFTDNMCFCKIILFLFNQYFDKIWCFLVQPDWKNDNDALYSEQVMQTTCLTECSLQTNAEQWQHWVDVSLSTKRSQIEHLFRFGWVESSFDSDRFLFDIRSG